MARTNNLSNYLTDVASAIKQKTGSSESISAANFDTEIANIPVGELTNEEYTEANNDVDSILNGTVVPSGTVSITQNGEYDVTNYMTANVNISSEKDVNFYDYDGTLLYSYTKAEFLALENLPENPSHTGLVAQGWNWNLVEAKAFVTTYGILDIGQMYTTSSGLSEFDIELNSIIGLSFTLNMNGTKNWGDGTIDTEITHTYTQAGKYTITCNGVPTNNYLFGQSTSAYNYSVINVRRASNITTTVKYMLACCYSLEKIILPSAITSILQNGVYACPRVKCVVIPNAVTTLGSSSFILSTAEHIILPKAVTTINISNFNGCQALKRIILPDNITSIGNSLFQSDDALETITIPPTITTIRTSMFSGCYNMKKYDFTHYSSVPTLSNVNAFSNINRLTKIVVPDNLYNDWIIAENWSTYANYIVKASEV